MFKIFSLLSLLCLTAAALQADPAIVVASELLCRSEPNKKGQIIARFPFGYPLEFTERSKQDVVVAGISGRWVKERRKECWLFDGYLRYPKISNRPPRLAQSDLFLCDIATGGIPSTFTPLLFGDMFVVPILVHSYFMASSPGEAAFGIQVGRYEENSASIRFTVTDAAYYDNLLKPAPPPQIPRITPVFRKATDTNGTYYYAEYTDRHHLNRERAIAECQFTGFYEYKTGRHPVDEEFATFTDTPLEKIQLHFPLVRNRGKAFVPVGWSTNK